MQTEKTEIQKLPDFTIEVSSILLHARIVKETKYGFARLF